MGILGMLDGLRQMSLKANTLILTTVLVLGNLPSAQAQDWQEWVKQNPTYPNGVQPQPARARTSRTISPECDRLARAITAYRQETNTALERYKKGSREIINDYRKDAARDIAFDDPNYISKKNRISNATRNARDIRSDAMEDFRQERRNNLIRAQKIYQERC